MHAWVLLSRGRLSELGVRVNHATPSDSVQNPFVVLKLPPII